MYWCTELKLGVSFLLCFCLQTGLSAKRFFGVLAQKYMYYFYIHSILTGPRRHKYMAPRKDCSKSLTRKKKMKMLSRSLHGGSMRSACCCRILSRYRSLTRSATPRAAAARAVHRGGDLRTEITLNTPCKSLLVAPSVISCSVSSIAMIKAPVQESGRVNFPDHNQLPRGQLRRSEYSVPVAIDSTGHLDYYGSPRIHFQRSDLRSGARSFSGTLPSPSPVHLQRRCLHSSAVSCAPVPPSLTPQASELLAMAASTAAPGVTETVTFTAGNSPVVLMQNFIEAMHIYGGLPWWCVSLL